MVDCNSIFLRRSFLNLTVKKNMKIGPFVTKFCHLALGGPVIMSHRVVTFSVKECMIMYLRVSRK